MYPFHVLFISKGRYEVCSDDGRYSREFTTRDGAQIFADTMNAGKSEQEALGALGKMVQQKLKARKAAKLRSEAMRDLGLSRNRDGSYE
jgi:hypothetical protein